jgi:hypothetical protein
MTYSQRKLSHTKSGPRKPKREAAWFQTCNLENFKGSTKNGERKNEPEGEYKEIHSQYWQRAFVSETHFHDHGTY